MYLELLDLWYRIDEEKSLKFAQFEMILPQDWMAEVIPGDVSLQ